MSQKEIKIAVQFISYNELEQGVKCPESRRIIEDHIDGPPKCQLLPEKPSLSLDYVLRANKKK